MLVDLRYAVRSLLQAKGFTAAAVLTLMLGIDGRAGVKAGDRPRGFEEAISRRPTGDMR